MADAGLVTDPGEGIEGEHCCQIDERASDRRDRDPPPPCRVAAANAARVVCSQAGDTALRRCGHLRGWRGAAQDAQKVCGGHSAEQGPLATSQDCCEVARFDAWCLVTNAKNPAMYAMQGATLHALLDFLGGDARAL